MTKQQRMEWAEEQVGPNRAQRRVIALCDHEPKTSEVVDGPHCCNECWNASIAARKAQEKVIKNAAKREAAEWWAARGVKPGDELRRAPASELGGILGIVHYGKARAGQRGPWVQIGRDRTQYDPNGWQKA